MQNVIDDEKRRKEEDNNSKSSDIKNGSRYPARKEKGKAKWNCDLVDIVLELRWNGSFNFNGICCCKHIAKMKKMRINSFSCCNPFYWLMKEVFITFCLPNHRLYNFFQVDFQVPRLPFSWQSHSCNCWSFHFRQEAHSAKQKLPYGKLSTVTMVHELKKKQTLRDCFVKPVFRIARNRLTPAFRISVLFNA